MAYTAPSYYSSSKDSRYPSAKAPANVAAPPSSYGGSSFSPPWTHSPIDTYSSVYKASSHYAVGHPGTTSAYPTYSTSSIPRSQAPSQYYQQSHSAYPSSHSAYPSSHSSSKSYDSNEASGYASSHSSVSSGTMPPSSSSAMYPASPKRPYSCDQCALSFDRSHDLKRHRDSHSGAKPFECPSCSRTFTRKDALKRHQSQKQCGLEDA